MALKGSIIALKKEVLVAGLHQKLVISITHQMQLYVI